MSNFVAMTNGRTHERCPCCCCVHLCLVVLHSNITTVVIYFKKKDKNWLQNLLFFYPNFLVYELVQCLLLFSLLQHKLFDGTSGGSGGHHHDHFSRKVALPVNSNSSPEGLL